MRRFLVHAVPLFEAGERDQGRDANLRRRASQEEIEEGAAFDVALLPRPELDGLVAAGKIAPDATADVTRSAWSGRSRPGAQSRISAASRASNARCSCAVDRL